MDQLVLFVVDENAIHRNLLLFSLKREGYKNCMAIPNAAECFYHLEKGVRPDYIIIDFLAIARNPQSFFDQIRKAGSSIRIIIFTDHDDPVLAQLLFEQGVFDYILKQGPLLSGQAELIKNLRYILKSH
jgi:DNA-binding NtrC family response regulator